MGKGAQSVKFVGRGSIDGKVCETFFVTFKNGATAIYNTFEDTFMRFDMVIMTTTGSYNIRIESGKFYGALLDRICDYMETGKKTMADVSDIIESIKIMLAGKASKENGGIEVNRRIRKYNPSFDGYEFENNMQQLQENDLGENIVIK